MSGPGLSIVGILPERELTWGDYALCSLLAGWFMSLVVFAAIGFGGAAFTLWRMAAHIADDIRNRRAAAEPSPLELVPDA